MIILYSVDLVVSSHCFRMQVQVEWLEMHVDIGSQNKQMRGMLVYHLRLPFDDALFFAALTSLSNRVRFLCFGPSSPKSSNASSRDLAFDLASTLSFLLRILSSS